MALRADWLLDLMVTVYFFLLIKKTLNQENTYLDITGHQPHIMEVEAQMI